MSLCIEFSAGPFQNVKMCISKITRIHREEILKNRVFSKYSVRIKEKKGSLSTSYPHFVEKSEWIFTKCEKLMHTRY